MHRYCGWLLATLGLMACTGKSAKTPSEETPSVPAAAAAETAQDPAQAPVAEPAPPSPSADVAVDEFTALLTEPGAMRKLLLDDQIIIVRDLLVADYGRERKESLVCASELDTKLGEWQRLLAARLEWARANEQIACMPAGENGVPMRCGLGGDIDGDSNGGIYLVFSSSRQLLSIVEVGDIGNDSNFIDRMEIDLAEKWPDIESAVVKLKASASCP